jgi:hypothetical protein
MVTTLTASKVPPFLLWTVFLALPLGLPEGWASSPVDEESFDFRTGTRWKYVGTAGGLKTTLAQEVFKISQGDLFVKGELATIHHILMRTQSESARGQRELISTTSYLGLEGDYFVTGTLAGVPVRVYKLGSRKGDTWPCTDPRLKSVPDRVFTHLGVEKVAVPAGIFRNARHVQVVIEAEGGLHTGDFYIVPGIGIVKTRAVSETGGRKTEVFLELESFTPSVEF